MSTMVAEKNNDGGAVAVARGLARGCGPAGRGVGADPSLSGDGLGWGPCPPDPVPSSAFCCLGGLVPQFPPVCIRENVTQPPRWL